MLFILWIYKELNHSLKIHLYNHITNQAKLFILSVISIYNLYLICIFFDY